MTNLEIVSNLHKMVDRFGEMLDNPIFEGTLPTVRITCKPDEDGVCLALTVGAEFTTSDE